MRDRPLKNKVILIDCPHRKIPVGVCAKGPLHSSTPDERAELFLPGQTRVLSDDLAVC